MTVKKSAKQEPFLNTVARNLGYAAGALTKAAQGLTNNISVSRKTISSKEPATASDDSDSSSPSRKPIKRRMARTSAAPRRRKSSPRKAKKEAKNHRASGK